MASKQQEVEVLESWEEIEEADDLEAKFKSIIPPSKTQDTKSSNGVPFKIIINGDGRTQYPEPTVKILKRPSKDTQNANDSKVFQPKKTLQQREQEYAQARLRILGETTTAEKADEKISIVPAVKSRVPEAENVIRLPKGPDGTKGFNVRR